MCADQISAKHRWIWQKSKVDQYTALLTTLLAQHDVPQLEAFIEHRTFPALFTSLCSPRIFPHHSLWRDIATPDPGLSFMPCMNCNAVVSDSNDVSVALVVARSVVGELAKSLHTLPADIHKQVPYTPYLIFSPQPA